MNKNLAIIILATNSYFPLGIRLIHRLNHFYKGTSRLTFHFVSETNPEKHLNIENLIYHHRVANTWDEGTVLKLDMCKEIATNYEYDYLGCLDADSNIFRDFTDEELFSEIFVVEHRNNKPGYNEMHYELNKLSSAYVDPKDYQEIYFQTCYFGGTREKMLDMVNFAIKLRSVDRGNNVIAKWTDEGYLQKYFMNNKPTKIFNPHDQSDFPILIDDKGNGRDSFTTGKVYKPFESLSNNQYLELMRNILLLKNKNLLWNIDNNKVIIEK
jgi:hypothetical protein